jgi:hypothetical protein
LSSDNSLWVLLNSPSKAFADRFAFFADNGRAESFFRACWPHADSGGRQARRVSDGN